MAFSFLRAMRASVRVTLASLKRGAKRLHKASGEVFGQPYSLAVCQEAIARAHGFRNWHEADMLLKRGGRDRSLPPWSIESRNDLHEAVLSAMVTLEVELHENGPVILLGDQKAAAKPAVCLVLETMSSMGKAGLFLVNTKAKSLQDTDMGRAVAELGLESVVDEFRFLDAREDNLGVSISTSGKDWANSLCNALSEEHRDALEDSGARQLLVNIMEAMNRRWALTRGGEYAVSARDALTAIACLSSSSPIIPREAYDAPESIDSIEYDFSRLIKQRPMEALRALFQLIDSIEGKGLNVGRVFSDESQHRPTVLLFDQDDAASVAIASVIHSLYYWRYVGHELRYQGIHTRPVLYFADRTEPVTCPAFLSTGGGTFTCFVTGWSRDGKGQIPEHFLSNARMLQVDPEFMIHNGRRVRYAIDCPVE